MEKVQRVSFLNSYVENMICYLKSAYHQFLKDNPDSKQNAILTDDQLRAFIKDIVRTKIKRPNVSVIEHASYGNAAQANYDLLTFTNKIYDKVITPSGSVYKTAAEHPSFLREKIIKDKAGRKEHKLRMFKYKAAGDSVKANLHNVMQSLLKIFMNSIIGAMGSKFSYLSDIAGFNAVTSLARYFIMNAYAQTERILNGNFYLTTKEAVINHIILVKRICPSSEKIMHVINKFDLYIPDWNDVYNFLNDNYKKYHNENLGVQISDILFNSSKEDLIFLYYFNNLKNIFNINTSKFTKWINEFYISDVTDDVVKDIDPEMIFKLDKDLITIISTVYTDMLPLEASGKKVSIYDTVKDYPHITKKLVYIGMHMTNKLENEFNEIFQLFFDTTTIIPNTIEHKNMFRESVILSDTDSVVFTTKWWLQWYTHDTKINHDVYKINSFVVYVLVKAIYFLMRNISIHKGALGEDIYGMKMKNEFYYPIMIQSSLKKHYAGLIAVQEGVVLPKLQPDIKGVNFKGSKLSDITRTVTKNFIIDTCNQIIAKGKVSAKERIWEIVKFEQRVYQSIKKGELTFLNVVPVKNAKEYKNEEISIYFNYKFWEEVFAPKYGNIMIPTKCYVLPLLNIKHPTYLDYLKKTNNEMYIRMLKFFDAYPKKEITRIPINPISDNIPQELLPVMSMRQIIYDNSIPLALFIKSLGISLGNNDKSRILLSEIYGYDISDSAVIK